jgi:hypothetical protein
VSGRERVKVAADAFWQTAIYAHQFAKFGRHIKGGIPKLAMPATIGRQNRFELRLFTVRTIE